MRLTCPNCGAQYEVDGSMIPDDGRDVQCSNCGQTWFQMPEGQLSVPDTPPVEEKPAKAVEAISEETAAEEPAAEPETAAEQPSEDTGAGPEPSGVAEDDAGQSEEAAGETEDQPEPSSIEAALHAQKDTIAEDAEEAAADPAGDAPDEADEADAAPEDEAPVEAEPADEATVDDTPEDEPARREVDAAVLGILREEAEREVAARRQERGEPLETQTEMGLAEAAQTDPADGGSGLPQDPEDLLEEPVEAAGSRSDLLPDVEEINSSLRPADQHEDGVGPDDPVAQEENKRRGFRSGFVAIVTVAAGLVLAYVFAPQIVQTVPAAEPVVIIYLDLADSARTGLDNAMARSVEGLSELLANMGGDEGN